MSIPVITYSGEDTGRVVSLSEEVFGIEPNDHAIYLDVKQHRANQRQGTHKAKERSEVRGSTRKIKKQKGSGTARAGSKKSPIFRGGGRAFGPRPRNYSFKLNKKLKELARRSALSYKAKDSCIAIVEDLTFEAPKTKTYISMLHAMELNSKKTLLVLPESNKNVILSSRNIQNAKVIVAENINTYDVLDADNLIISEGAVSKIDNLLKKK